MYLNLVYNILVDKDHSVRAPLIQSRGLFIYIYIYINKQGLFENKTKYKGKLPNPFLHI
jgi:hypothetical protein